MRGTLELFDDLELAVVELREGSSIVTNMNGAATRLLGDAWLERVHPTDRKLVERACAGGASRSVAFRFTRDNLKFQALQMELRRKDSVTLGIITEPAVRESSSEAELEAIIEALPFEVWERDADGILIRQNRTAYRNRAADLGSTVASMSIPAETVKLWNELNDRAYRGETVSVPIDYDFGGRRITHINIIAPVREGDRIRGIVGVNVDITAVRAAEAERDALQATLIKSERLAALGELAAVVAHEVRNPLAAIYNSLSTLKRHLTPDREATLLLGILEEESKRLNRTVEDLLSYVRPLQPQRRADDLVGLARDVVRQRLEATPDARIESEMILSDAKLDPVEIDAVLMRIALSNLVTNAVQAMPDGGKLTVSVRDAHHGVALAVHDTGRGIPKDNLGRVFEPFFTTRASGSGLGLAVVRRILEAHEGSVTVESDEHTGTVFTLQLPRR